MGRHTWHVSGSAQQRAASHLQLTWSRAPPGLAFVTANCLDTDWQTSSPLPFLSFFFFFFDSVLHDPDKSSAIVAVTSNMRETLFRLSAPSVDISNNILQLPLRHVAVCPSICSAVIQLVKFGGKKPRWRHHIVVLCMKKHIYLRQHV